MLNKLCNKSCCTKCCSTCKKIPTKRYLLPFLGVLVLTPFEEYRTLVYLPIIISFASIILFWNFTWIVYYTASKPLYYDDLFIDVKKLPNYEVDNGIKKKFKFILEFVLIITNSILMGILSDVWILRNGDNTEFLFALGTTGGIIKIFQIVNNTISRGMLKILRGCILKESAERQKKKKIQILELINLKEIKEEVLDF